MRLSLRNVLVFGFTAVLCAMLPAEILYVAPNGNDRNPGTLEKPLQTPRAVGRLLQGRPEVTEVVFKEGIYSADMYLKAEDGAASKTLPTLLVRAEKGKEVVFDGAKYVIEAETVLGRKGVFRIPHNFNPSRKPDMWEEDTRVRYLTVADKRAVFALPGTFTYGREFLTFHTSDDRSFKDHKIGTSGSELGIFANRSNTIIEGFTFRNFQTWHHSTGVDIRAENVIVRNCKAWNCSSGFIFADSSVKCRIENCRVDDCGTGVRSVGKDSDIIDSQFFKRRDRFIVPTYQQSDSGIIYYGASGKCLVRGNLVRGFHNAIFLKTSGDYTAEHNTILDGEWGFYRSGWGPGNKIIHNIIVGFSQPFLAVKLIQPGCEVDYNCIWEPRERKMFHDSIGWLIHAGTGKHNLLAAPRFVAPARGDYRLLPDSPCGRLGTHGKPLGAFELTQERLKDIDPPQVRLEFDPPIVPAGASGEMFFEKDPWIGGGRSFVKKLFRPAKDSDYTTRSADVNLNILAVDAAGKPDRMKIRIGDGDWNQEETFHLTKKLKLPDQDGVHAVSVRVSDHGNNWSIPATVRVRLSRQAPSIVGGTTVYANSNGVIISFQSSAPAYAEIDYGREKTLSSKKSEANYVHRRWESNDGGDWVEEWREPRTVHHIALIAPEVEARKRYYYRVVVRDGAGNETRSDLGSFKVAGKNRTFHVSKEGRDEDGGGSLARPFASIQFAVDRALPGDRIVILPGLYFGETYLSHGGIAGTPITIEARKFGEVVIDGMRKSTALFRLEKTPHVTIRNLEMRWYKGTGNGIYIVDSPSVTVSGCKVWNQLWRTGWPQGIGIFAHRSPGLTVERNLLIWQEHGMYLLKSPGARIFHNTATRNLYAALRMPFSAANSIVRNNSFCFNGNDQMAIEEFDARDLETFDSDYNNFACSVIDYPMETDNPDLRNRSKAVIGCLGKRYCTLKLWQEFSGKDKHSIFVDPEWMDPRGHDFRLRPNSPNIGTGEKRATIGAFGVKD